MFSNSINTLATGSVISGPALPTNKPGQRMPTLWSYLNLQSTEPTEIPFSPYIAQVLPPNYTAGFRFNLQCLVKKENIVTSIHSDLDINNSLAVARVRNQAVQRT